MPRSLLPPGTKLAPGTPVKITHSDCKGKQIHENTTVLADGVSTRSSLPIKMLVNMKMSWWNVYYTPPEPAQQKIYYHSSVSTKSLLSKRYIALCNKRHLPVWVRHKYASCACDNSVKSLAEDINTPSQGRTQQPSSAEPQPSTSSAGHTSLQPTSSSQTAPTPKHKTMSLPPGLKLPSGTPVKITHSDCKGKRIHETSFVSEDGISTRSYLPVKMLVDMKVTWWSVSYTPPGITQPKSYYSGRVSTKSICLGRKCIALCNKSSIAASYKYASCANSTVKSLAETINTPPQDSSQPIPAEPQPSTSSAGQQKAASASPQPSTSSAGHANPQPTSSNQTS